jgi:Tetratricopeptide repeat
MVPPWAMSRSSAPFKTTERYQRPTRNRASASEASRRRCPGTPEPLRARIGRSAFSGLLLALHTGRAGYPAITEHLLTPLLDSGDAGPQDAARAVLYASAGPQADTRLQNVILQAELTALPAGSDDDRLRIHLALADNHNALGEYRQALTHAQHELDLRLSIRFPDHPDTVRSRNKIACLISRSGDIAGALRLSRDLLPDLSRVLGPHHPDTLITRDNIAAYTGQCGDAAGALRLSRDLLPDRERVLGPDHPDIFATRSNIAYWTGMKN